MKRSIPLLVAGVVAAGLLAGCGDDETSTTPAATVDTVEITNQDLVDELDAIEGNTDYLAALEAQAEAAGEEPIRVDDGEFATSFVTETLGVRIQYQIVTNEVAARDLAATETCVDEATQQLVERYAGASPDQDGEAVLDAFTDDYRSYLIDRQTDLLLLQADLNEKECGDVPTDEEVQAYLDAHPELLAETACVSHILVETPEEAAEIKALLDGGADFAELAAERSTDTNSGAAGGELGCGPAGQYTEAFDEAVFSQPVGEVGDPVTTEFGVHLILVTERGLPTLEDLRPTIESALQQEAQQAFVTWFEGALADAEVTVDARFGTWDPVQGAITPPAVEVTDTGEG